VSRVAKKEEEGVQNKRERFYRQGKLSTHRGGPWGFLCLDTEKENGTNLDTSKEVGARVSLRSELQLQGPRDSGR